MLFIPEAAGPHDPVAATPPRRPGSVRRTSSIDTTRPDGFEGAAAVDARARDLRTDGAGAGEVLGEVRLRARISPTRKLEEVEAWPPVPGLAALVGSRVGAGFRARVDEVLPGQRAGCTPLYLLLDDLVGASLVAGYAFQRTGGLDALVGDQPVGDRRRLLADMSRDDVCAGWAHEATLMTTVREQGTIPVPMGPPAPALEPAGDPRSWHAMDPLPPHGVRRRRRMDLLAPPGHGEPHAFDAHFRDSHVDVEGQETVLHEYTVTGRVDATADRVVEATARAQVLPWVECPGAVASAGRLAGMDLAAVRERVRRELVGRTTCTHLNDTLRALADLSALLAELAPTGGADAAPSSSVPAHAGKLKNDKG